MHRAYPQGRRRPVRVALDGVSAEIGAGEFVALLGPNGSGKSTLLRIAATLDRPDSGRVASSGLSLSDRRAVVAHRARLGVVFQQPGLDRLLTVRENLLAEGALHGLSRQAASDAANRVADELGLSERLRDRVGTLSGGLARRCDLARALLSRPSLLLLDEPTTGLDHAAREEFLELLDRVRADTGATILMTTHLMDEALRADRVLLLHRGRIVRRGAPDALRRAVGHAVLRWAHADHQADSIASRHGLMPASRGAERVAIAPEASDGLAAAAAELAAAGVSFSIGPPTLGDVYLEATGETLSPAGERAP